MLVPAPRLGKSATVRPGDEEIRPTGSGSSGQLPIRCEKPKTGSVLQSKVRLLGFSPMIWHRFQVPETLSLHELHGVLQVATGWEAIHLFQFNIHGIVHAGPILPGRPVDMPLSDSRFRRNAKFRYVCEFGCRWGHERRVEDCASATPGTRYPTCTTGSGACPQEECGGPDGFFAGRENATGLDALEDIQLLAELADQVMPQGNRSMLEDDDMRWRVEMASDRCGLRARFPEKKFNRGPVNKRFRAGEHLQLMHQQMM